MDFTSYAKVLSAIKRGQLTHLHSSFTNDQLQPFLPYLASWYFHQKSDTAGAPEQFLARISTLCDRNLLNFICADFASIAKRLYGPARKLQPLNKFSAQPSPTEKLYTLAANLLHLTFTSNQPVEVVHAEDGDLFAQLLALVLLFLPEFFSLSALTTKMLLIQDGPRYFCAALCSVPSAISAVFDHLLRIDNLAEESARGRNRAQMLAALLSLSPSFVPRAISVLSTQRRDAQLVVRLCTQFASEQQFLRFLISELPNRDGLIGSKLHKNTALATIQVLNKRLFSIISRAPADATSSELILCLAQVMLLPSNLKQRAPDEMAALISFLTTQFEDPHLLELSLCTLLAYPGFCSPPQGTQNPVWNMDPKISEFFQWLKARVIDDGICNSCLVSAALSAWCGRPDELAKYLSIVLGAHVVLNTRHFNALRVLLQNLFPEKDLAQLVLQVRAPMFTGEWQPIQWVRDMLAQGVFNKHRVDVKSWFENQICAAAFPIDSSLSEILDSYADSVVKFDPRSGLTVDFCEKFVKNFDTESSSAWVRCGLVLQYLLMFRLKYGIKAYKETCMYDSLIKSLPLRYLLSVISVRGDEFRTCAVSIAGASAALFSYCLPTRESTSIVLTRSPPIPQQTLQMIRSAFSCTNFKSAIPLLNKLLKAPVDILLEFIQAIPRAALKALPTKEQFASEQEDTTEYVYADVVSKLWLRLFEIHPRAIVEETVRQWNVEYFDIQRIYEQPCLVFNIDKRVSASPPHFAVFIKIISFALEAAKVEAHAAVAGANIRSQQADENKKQVGNDERDRAFNIADHSQRAAVVQLLLEDCDAKCNTLVSSQSVLDAIRRHAMIFIHELFIHDIQVMKLVLFQTFPLYLIRPVVEGVPSLHIAQNEIQEMLSFPDTKRRIFAIIIMFEIFRKYRVESTFPKVQFVIDAICTLIRYETSANILMMGDCVVEQLVELAKMHPGLQQKTQRLLGQFSLIAESRLALYSSTLIARDVLEKRLISKISKLVPTLSSQLTVS